MTSHPVHEQVLRWYAANARQLPWRETRVDGWRVLVSEVMLQQTPVARVLPAYEAWIDRWPTPALSPQTHPARRSGCGAGSAIRGGPFDSTRRRPSSTMSTTVFVPADVETLRSLPGVGEYTASAVAAFAYRRRAVVLDTNVRRVIARAFSGTSLPPASITRPERALAESLLPFDGDVAATWSVGLMELGALLCTATSPTCSPCPIRDQCQWRAAGYPPDDGPPRRAQTYAGTDRQCRGRILAVLREAEGTVPRAAVEAVWDDPSSARASPRVAHRRRTRRRGGRGLPSTAWLGVVQRLVRCQTAARRRRRRPARLPPLRSEARQGAPTSAFP